MSEFLPTSEKKHSGKTSVLTWQLHSPNFGNDCSKLTLSLLNLCTWPSPACHSFWKLPPPLSAYWRKFYWTGSSSSFPWETQPSKSSWIKWKRNKWERWTKQLVKSDWAALLSCSTNKPEWANLGQQSCGQRGGDCNCLCSTTASKKNMWVEPGEHPPPNPLTTHCNG